MKKEKFNCLIVAAMVVVIALTGCDLKENEFEEEENESHWAEWPKGRDVYVAGYEEVQGVHVARLWKNGKVINLIDSIVLSEARSVFVSNNDVYVAGFETIDSREFVLQAKLWKNGESINLTDETSGGMAYSVFVIDEDVYVSGYEYFTPESQSGAIMLTGPQARLWINGKPLKLTIEKNQYSIAYSVFVK